MIEFIYAQDLKGAIGYQNRLPWYFPEDLAFFKKETLNHTIVMGRKTFESMGKRLLPKRQSLVLTTNRSYGQEISGLIVKHTREEILALAAKEKVYIIGGVEIFSLFKEDVTRISRTLIHDCFEADRFMPPLDEEQWQLTWKETVISSNNQTVLEFQKWQKK